jgi:sporulation protein YlmC with PRC-barrel domain
MLLVRDVMDNQLLRKDGQHMGKVDGLVIELRDGAPPKVAFIETGADVLARRISARLGDWIARLRRRFFGDDRAIKRVPWDRVRDVGVDIEIDVPDTSATQLQDWLVRHVIRRVPGERDD